MEAAAEVGGLIPLMRNVLEAELVDGGSGGAVLGLRLGLGGFTN